MPAQARPDPAGDRLVMMVRGGSGGVDGLGGNTRGGSGQTAGVVTSMVVRTGVFSVRTGPGGIEVDVILT